MPGLLHDLVDGLDLAGYVPGDACCDRHLEHFALISHHHQDDPSCQSCEADQHRDKPIHRPEAKETAAYGDGEDQDDTDQEQRAEDHDRLCRMKAYERPLVDEQKDDPGEPTKNVAKQPGYVLLHAPGNRLT